MRKFCCTTLASNRVNVYNVDVTRDAIFTIALLNFILYFSTQIILMSVAINARVQIEKDERVMGATKVSTELPGSAIMRFQRKRLRLNITTRLFLNAN